MSHPEAGTAKAVSHGRIAFTEAGPHDATAHVPPHTQTKPPPGSNQVRANDTTMMEDTIKHDYQQGCEDCGGTQSTRGGEPLTYSDAPSYAVLCFSEAHRAAWPECVCDTLDQARAELEALRADAPPGVYYRHVGTSYAPYALRMAMEWYGSGLSIVAISEDAQAVAWRPLRRVAA